MSPTVTIRFNEKEFEAVQKLFKNNSQTVGALIKKLALEASGYKEELEVTVQDIDKKHLNYLLEKNLKYVIYLAKRYGNLTLLDHVYQ